MTASETTTSTARGWRHLERYAYVQRPYEAVWAWLAGHLSELGTPLPDGGHAVELRIRPGGKEVSRPVRLHVGGLVADDSRARASLGWADATQPRLFPRLEAVVEIAPVPHDTMPFTQVGVLARYLPPLGHLGAIGDRLVGAEITDVALATFLDELADAVARHTDAPTFPAAGDQPQPGDVEQGTAQRIFFTVEGLAVRHGGAVGVCQVVTAAAGVIHVSLDPRAGLLAVDYDPATCDIGGLADAINEQPPTPA